MSGRAWRLEPAEGAYPGCLRELGERRLPTLHGAGRREAVEGLAHERAVTIVGTRRPSAHGLRVAERLAGELALAGVVVVSGMARGIDAAAHRGALAAGGTTIAVLAGGPEAAYPATNRHLHQRILATGAAVSEHPPGYRPQRSDFAARNRIMAALGSVVVIVEASLPAGSLITADVAAKLGRTVGAVPGPVGTRSAAGVNQLIKEGSELIRDARDVLDLLYGVGRIGPVGNGEDGHGEQPRPARVRTAPPGPPLGAELERVLEQVESGAATVDQVAAALAIEPRQAALALARLELLGYVAAGPLGGFERSSLRAPAAG